MPGTPGLRCAKNPALRARYAHVAAVHVALLPLSAFETNPRKTGVVYPVYKKHVIYFMKHQCGGLFVDFAKLMNNKVLITDGEFPLQWYGIQKVMPVVDVVPKPLPLPEIQPSRVHDLNGSMNEEEAFGAALRQSVIEMPPSPVIKHTSTHLAPNLVMHVNLPFEEAPIDLCCPSRWLFT
eukprot:7387898-Prymnesium_polylepis.1